MTTLTNATRGQWSTAWVQAVGCGNPDCPQDRVEFAGETRHDAKREAVRQGWRPVAGVWYCPRCAPPDATGEGDA